MLGAGATPGWAGCVAMVPQILSYLTVLQGLALWTLP
jgi:hypothetical protein